MASDARSRIDAGLLAAEKVPDVDDLENVEESPVDFDKDGVEGEWRAGDEATVVAKEGTVLARDAEVDGCGKLESPGEERQDLVGVDIAALALDVAGKRVGCRKRGELAGIDRGEKGEIESSERSLQKAMTEIKGAAYRIDSTVMSGGGEDEEHLGWVVAGSSELVTNGLLPDVTRNSQQLGPQRRHNGAPPRNPKMRGTNQRSGTGCNLGDGQQRRVFAVSI